ncbi:NAD-dependent epimerase/dehydratase family protein [Actinocatenispora rupis]|uniref:UDP-glucose 4-epimerase n=1 Tax=Actinocatenispora rupis TaxID=519421 RepID=A0A8J3J0P1_9ACTN|nr:NAD-dependent epimerase/dehydratase family protein [Actinocatenispora rupis]GID13646.1 UDP-glucose 4-epimerase [Actinocatenispora rupis]
MSHPRTVLVTGVSRYFAAQAAGRLAADARVDRVLGVDVAEPTGELTELLGRAEFVRADISSPAIASLIEDAAVDTVAHLAVVAGPGGAGGRDAMKELNVIGTLQLLAACQRSKTVRHLVVRSSTAAYGASPRDPAIFTEDTGLRALPRGGYAKDIVEIEGYVRGFRRRRPDVSVTVLRFAPFVGSRADTTLTRYFSLPLVPTVLGHDPRVQFVHADDAIEVLCRAVVEDHPGAYNVAGPGVLLLSQAVRRAGRVPVPVPDPGMTAVARLARRSGLVDFSLDQLDFLVHGRVVDVRRLVDDFGYEPRSTPVAFDDFITGHGMGAPVSPGSVDSVERTLASGGRALVAGLRGLLRGGGAE